MRVTISPGKAAGHVAAPPSKSFAHRLLIAAALCDTPCEVKGCGASEDVMATRECLNVLRPLLKEKESPKDSDGKDTEYYLPAGASGSTLRFLIPLALTTGKRITFTGTRRLFARPLSVYEEICREEGFLFDLDEEKLTVIGNLKAKTYRIPGNISSQFVTGLLFALPGLDGDSRIELIPPVGSRPYIDMTLQVLERFGVKTFREDDRTIRVSGGQTFRSEEPSIVPEGDCSNAAFLEALNLLGGEVTVDGLAKDSVQGDKVYRKYFEELSNPAGTPDRVSPVQIDLTDCPDLGPVLFAVSAVRCGAIFTGAGRLKMKESNRLAAMREGLERFGICCEEAGDTFVVKAGKLKKPDIVLDGHDDHRIVMALSILATVTGGEISGAEAVRKSFPDFFEVLSGLGIPLCFHDEIVRKETI